MSPEMVQGGLAADKDWGSSQGHSIPGLAESGFSQDILVEWDAVAGGLDRGDLHGGTGARASSSGPILRAASARPSAGAGSGSPPGRVFGSCWRRPSPPTTGASTSWRSTWWRSRRRTRRTGSSAASRAAATTGCLGCSPRTRCATASARAAGAQPWSRSRWRTRPTLTFSGAGSRRGCRWRAGRSTPIAARCRSRTTRRKPRSPRSKHSTAASASTP